MNYDGEMRAVLWMKESKKKRKEKKRKHSHYTFIKIKNQKNVVAVYDR
jgi:hypothetical protein